MSPRELESIVNDGRRIARMEQYIAEHGGEFKWNQHTGWSYVPEQVISNKVEKVEKRAAKRSETQAKKRGLFRRKKRNEETE